MDWFGSEYYLKLYRNRNIHEARLFIDRLLNYLQPSPTDRFIDIACGRGRHAVYLADKGYKVVGIDASRGSIAFASQSVRENLEFKLHDMREPLGISGFQFALNLFTSFGYFDTKEEHQLTIQNFADMLCVNGWLVIDFMNFEQVVSCLVCDEELQLEQYHYGIKRSFDGAFVRKQIQVTDNGQVFHFEEKVMALHLEDFEKMLAQTGFDIVNIFGDYQLNHFEKTASERMILIAKKMGR